MRSVAYGAESLMRVLRRSGSGRVAPGRGRSGLSHFSGLKRGRPCRFSEVERESALPYWSGLGRGETLSRDKVVKSPPLLTGSAHRDGPLSHSKVMKSPALLRCDADFYAVTVFCVRGCPYMGNKRKRRTR